MSKEREDFEVWASARGMDTNRFLFSPDEFILTATQGQWLAWQAAQAAMRVELVQLRGFTVDVMDSWPGVDLKDWELQNIAERHGLVVFEIAHHPCHPGCFCDERLSDAEFADGVSCYRKAPILLDGGKS